MYWNSTRLYEALDSWYVYLYMNSTEILGSILICKPKMQTIEIFALFVEEVLDKEDIIESLLCQAIEQIRDEKKDIKQVIFFIEEKEPIHYRVALRAGFQEKGSYRCYAVDL